MTHPGPPLLPVAESAPTTQIEQLPLQPVTVERTFPSVSFDRMVDMAFTGGDTARAFVVLQPGRVMAIDSGGTGEKVWEFLDIRGRVSDRGEEEGLLGLALDPESSDNGYFYLYYSAVGPRRSVVSRFSIRTDDPDIGDPDSELAVLEVPQPFSNHNGGQVRFGPDGYLYIALGDGGGRGDPDGNGQNLATLLGSILRIDVRGLDYNRGYSIPEDNPFVDRPDARGEVWAYGLRNPWRFSFDQVTNDLWAGDVGQNRYEEIDLISRGGNYGWSTMEGRRCYPERTGVCDRSGLELPVAQYGREGGCSVTGGHVYRATRLPQLYGAYIYGDFCSGKIWAFRHDGSRVTKDLLLADTSLRISSFAQSTSGEIFVLSFDKRIYRFAP